LAEADGALTGPSDRPGLRKNTAGGSRLERMATTPSLTVRKLLSITPELAKAIADYRYQHRIPTESEATRRLIEIGLEATRQPPPSPARKRQSSTR
jgi:hypothetical protein